MDFIFLLKVVFITNGFLSVAFPSILHHFSTIGTLSQLSLFYFCHSFNLF